MRLKFELAYYDVIVLHVPPPKIKQKGKILEDMYKAIYTANYFSTEEEEKSKNIIIDKIILHK